MLYDRWLSVVKRFGSETALVDASDEREWTFAGLAREAEKGKADAPIVFPQTNCPEFIFAVLRAWRSNRVVCPLEPDQTCPRLADLPPEGVVHLKSTSATGGVRRMVAFTGEQLAADAANLVGTMGLRHEWPNLGAISLAHSYGFSNLVLPLLLYGVPLILVRAALPEALKRAAALRDVVTVPGVPALWRMWSDAASIPENIKLAISAGAPLALALEKSVFERFGIKIHNFYGSSECGGIAYDSSEALRDDGSCAGSPVQGVEISMDGRGCVTVQGAAVAVGYWPQPDARLSLGQFITSDIGEFQNGLLYLRGRVGDLINVAGRKVAPESIEQALGTHPLVRECLAFGVPLDEGHRGESIVACVAAEPGTSVEVLRRFACANLPAWQVPRAWWFVDTLKANERGKLSRAEWKARYLSRDRLAD